MLRCECFEKCRSFVMFQRHSVTILWVWNLEESPMHESPPHQLTMDATQHQMDDFTSLSAGLPGITTITNGLRSTF